MPLTLFERREQMADRLGKELGLDGRENHLMAIGPVATVAEPVQLLESHLALGESGRWNHLPNVRSYKNREAIYFVSNLDWAKNLGLVLDSKGQITSIEAGSGFPTVDRALGYFAAAGIIDKQAARRWGVPDYELAAGANEYAQDRERTKKRCHAAQQANPTLDIIECKISSVDELLQDAVRVGEQSVLEPAQRSRTA